MLRRWVVFVEAIEAVADGNFGGINPSNGNSKRGDHKIKQTVGGGANDGYQGAANWYPCNHPER